MKLSILPYNLTVARLSPDQQIPPWVWQDKSFLSITCTTDEVSIVCPISSVPADLSNESGWIAIKVQGLLDFSLTGILAALTTPLAAANIPIFAVSTFDTDYILIKQQYLSQAKETLEQSGHTFQE
jgi:hypothetical protein